MATVSRTSRIQKSPDKHVKSAKIQIFIGDSLYTHFQQNYLSNIVEGEPGEENVSKKLCHAEKSIYHPVGQPFCIIIFGGTFNGLNPEKRGEQNVT